jgi:hypothetical protein
VTEGAFESRPILRHGYALGTYYTKAVVATVADTDLNPQSLGLWY